MQGGWHQAWIRDMLLPALQKKSVQKGFLGNRHIYAKRPGLKDHVEGRSPCLGERLTSKTSVDTSVLDCSAAHWRELDTGQTQPETRRTSGDVETSRHSETVLTASDDGSAQAAGDASQVIRVVLVFLS